MDDSKAILQRLDRLVESVDKIAETVTKPKPLFWRIMEATAVIAGAAGIIAVVDIVVRWILELVRGG